MFMPPLHVSEPPAQTSCGLLVVALTHMGPLPHREPAGLNPHAPAPSQVPDLQPFPNVSHSFFGSVPASVGAHVPSAAEVFAAAHDEHVVLHAESQQNPSAQWSVAHCASPSEQDVPCTSFSLQTALGIAVVSQ